MDQECFRGAGERIREAGALGVVGRHGGAVVTRIENRKDALITPGAIRLPIRSEKCEGLNVLDVVLADQIDAAEIVNIHSLLVGDISNR